MNVLLQNECNILHMFPFNDAFQQTLLKEIRHQYFDLGHQEALNFIYYAVLPNNLKMKKKGRRPLSMAIKHFSPKCIDNMLELLSLDRHSPQPNDFMRYIEGYLLKLLKMQSPIFFKFFDESCVKITKDRAKFKKRDVFIHQ
jgi:hypothetical protein